MKEVHRYPARRYDERLVLKVPPLLWLVMVFLVRHVFLVLLSFLPRTGETMTYLRDLVNPWLLLADMPAVPVLITALIRQADPPGWLRALWRQGRLLLAVAALLYVAILALVLAMSPRPALQGINEAVIFSLLLHVAVVVYLARSRLVSDVFSDFPRGSDNG